MEHQLQGINNIIFDYGGVILNIDYLKTVEAFRLVGLKDFDRLYSQAMQIDLFDRLEKGWIGETDFYQAIRDISGLALPDRVIRDAWNAIILDMPVRRIRFLEFIGKKYRIFLLSNTNEIHYNQYIKQFQNLFGYRDFDGLFEKAYFSFQMGMKKPDAAIFERVLTENRLDKSETLFIDDSIQHIQAAEKLGLQVLLLAKGMEIVDLPL